MPQIKRMRDFRKLDKLVMSKLYSRLPRGNILSQLYCDWHRLTRKRHLRNSWYYWLKCLACGSLTTNCELMHTYPASLCMDSTVNIRFLFMFISSAQGLYVSMQKLKWRRIWKHPATLWWPAAHGNSRFWNTGMQGIYIVNDEFSVLLTQ